MLEPAAFSPLLHVIVKWSKMKFPSIIIKKDIPPPTVLFPVYFFDLFRLKGVISLFYLASQFDQMFCFFIGK